MTILELYKVLQKNNCRTVGCSNCEIAEIEQTFEINLPETYKEFLRLMGKKAGQFLEGSSAFYNDIFEIQEEARDLLQLNQFKELPQNTFVFFMHQGYQFAFFYLDESDDPQIYYFYEGRTKNEFEITGDTFSGFMEAHLKMSGM